MRELVYYVAVSLDGYIAAPDGTADAFPVQGDHIEAITTDFADALPSHAAAAMGVVPPLTRFDTVIMGWNSYTPALEAGIDSPYAHLRQFVASRRERSVPEEITLTDDPVASVRALKTEEGAGIYLCGGGELAGALRGEIDRLILKRYPIVFGSGVPLFGRTPYEPVPFTHVGTRRFDSGTAFEEYVRM